MTTTTVEVGTTIRLRRPQNPKVFGRAVVAYTTASSQEADGETSYTSDHDQVCVLWEPIPPQRLTFVEESSSKTATTVTATTTKFLIAPNSSNVKIEEEEEYLVDKNQIQELLPFETETAPKDEDLQKKADQQDSSSASANVISYWKDCGDQLLRLGDPSSAVPYYEIALSKSSHISIGSTAIIQVKGFTKLAEVDCVDDDESTVDMMVVETGEEMTIPKSHVLLAVLEPDPDSLQPRILLNLARCMIQLSEYDIATVNRPKYLKSAVLACSLVITLSSSDDNDDSGFANNMQTALLLRGKALGGLSKWPNAIADAKKLIKIGGSKEGQKLLQILERLKAKQIKTNKKLSKEVARWVQTATNESSVSDDHHEKERTSTSGDNAKQQELPTKPSPVSSLLSIALPLLAAILIHQYMTSS